jgi:hypothetical protein
MATYQTKKIAETRMDTGSRLAKRPKFGLDEAVAVVA